MNAIISAIKAFVGDEAGVTAIEYGLIAALIGVAVAATAGTIGDDIKAAFAFIANKLPDTYT